MTKTLVHSVIGVNKYTLLVFYTDARSWQFRVIGGDGAVFGQQKLYYTAEAALNAARDWIGTGIG